MPSLAPQVEPYLTTSAIAAAQQCCGFADGIYEDACGNAWTDRTHWDGSYGAGQQMSALSVIQGLLINQAGYPVGKDTGGISKGNASAGTGGDTAVPGVPSSTQITSSDRAGAGVLTAFLLVGLLAGTWWMIS